MHSLVACSDEVPQTTSRVANCTCAGAQANSAGEAITNARGVRSVAGKAFNTCIIMSFEFCGHSSQVV
ncbi:hypothetical protein [Labilibaculum antarcticum]|uniref:hypothetical protein n=1 Tax=Labilibaculum antarcticum TaxID=1717717 RepID=UPI0011AB45A7|nr:hypothetical protein [Labilibaculum antarcticum]